MSTDAPRIVVFDPRADERDAWPGGLGGSGTRIDVCREAREALRLLFDADDHAALVARVSSDDVAGRTELLLLMHAARMREPPASIVVLTRDPESARALLASQGVTAEVLRSPASIEELLARLGA